MSRIETLTKEELSPEQIKAHDAIFAGPRGCVRGPLLAWLHAPTLAARAQALGEYCRFGSSLPPRLSELAILTTAAVWRAGYEWYAHEPMALKAGLDPTVVGAIRAGVRPQFALDDERAVYETAFELITARAISPTTWKRAHAILGTRGMIDLIGILGYYGLISMTITGLEIELPPGVPEPFEFRN